MQNVPKEGSIEIGEVARIEPYGAFVQLSEYERVRGLLHISQISDIRLDSVEDALSMGDRVWVKVEEVVQESHGPDSAARPRWKISLRMKGIAQDGTAREQEETAQASEKVSRSIEQNLNSSIGMAVALDPMAGTGLVLKHDPSRKSTLINGYALVDDTEGEPPEPLKPEINPGKPVQQEVVRPMGRGRGSTLPAWMTQQSSGPVRKSGDEASETSRQNRRKRSKKTKHRKRDRSSDRGHSSRRRHYDSDSDDSSLHDRRRKKKHKRRKRSRSRSSERKHSKSRKRKSRGHYSDSNSEASEAQFKSVDEAERIVRELERKSRTR